MTKEQSKERITITLRPDLLPLLDAAIDGAKIRNRSHAIEYILTQHLGSGIRRAVILAGGEGVNMRPFTLEMPKPILPIKGRPLLEHTIATIRDAGIRDIVVVVGYKGEMIKEKFGDGSRFDVRLTYVTQRGKGTASALASVKQFLDRPFLLYYADVLTNMHLKNFLEFHGTHPGIGSVALTASRHPEAYGVVGLRGTEIRSFAEKPTGDVAGLVSAGIFVFDPEIAPFLPNAKNDVSLERDVLPRLAKDKKLHGYPFEAKWFDIATPEAYEQAIREWENITE